MALQIEEVKKEARKSRENLLTFVPAELLECYVQQRIWLALKSGRSGEAELLS